RGTRTLACSGRRARTNERAGEAAAITAQRASHNHNVVRVHGKWIYRVRAYAGDDVEASTSNPLAARSHRTGCKARARRVRYQALPELRPVWRLRLPERRTGLPDVRFKSGGGGTPEGPRWRAAPRHSCRRADRSENCSHFLF